MEGLKAMYAPADGFRAKSHVGSRAEYDAMYKRSIEDPEAFWSDIAEGFYWHKKWTTPFHKSNFDMKKGPIHVEWFSGAETNLCYNALDRHVEGGLGDKAAFLWEGNDVGVDMKLTYKEVLDQVSQLANYMKSLGIKRGDVVTIYLPMICELPMAMLACARIGAVHSVVFGGFSSEALADRIVDCQSKVVFTASAVMRGPKPIGLKSIVDAAIDIAKAKGFEVERCVAFDNPRAAARADVKMAAGRDSWWQDAVSEQSTECPVEWMGAEDPLFRLYTSGSTGKPKGVVHTTAGYMVGAATTTRYVFDLHADDVFWCTADAGWITGHSYVAYGPMINGATQIIFEGVPTYPDAGRFWEVCDKYKVSVFYTAPTAIRALMRCGDEPVTKHSRSSLRLLGTVGEPINPEAWRWYYEVVGGSRCPIVDTWWQTETGAHMITSLPGAVDMKPGSATLPFFGVQPAILDDKGNELEGECQGVLCIKQPWPSMMRTVAGDHARFEATYFAAYKGYYFTGDGCRRDKDGYYWITGRVDDVINVSGHRIGTAEVESALVGHPACAEAAVVGYEHPIKGEGIYAYVTLMEGHEQSAETRKALVSAVRGTIGAFAAPDVIHWAPGLPKTRSGKIMRRILRKIAAGLLDELGDTSTLADPSVVDQLIANKGK